ncbi:MAG: PIN domain-containing protein [Betaproteobacteria bacterium]|nr:PIN domain-containing protein [Betaproteobacteria bacterium]
MTEPQKTRQPSGIRRGDLPDVNVWLALAATQHPHHEAAAAYWSQREDGQVWFCRITMLGLVRLLSNPKVMGGQALSLTQALAAYDRFAALPEIGLHAERLDCNGQLRQYVAQVLPARLLTDAYLAAFAVTARLRLVTFDRDFDRFEGLDCLRLNAASH